MRYHLFVIGGPYTDSWWQRNLSMGVITAGFDNEDGDRGSRYLCDMDANDWVIAYATGSGAVGAGSVGGANTYRILRRSQLPHGYESRHRQFRSVKWECFTASLADAVPFRDLRLGFPPRNTKTVFSDPDIADRIIQLICAKSGHSSPHVALEAADLGPPRRVPSTTYRVLRDTVTSRRVKVMHGFRCQLCGETVRLADGSGYAEGHHLRPLGRPHHGPDVAENILCVCPNHHAACDLGAIRLHPSQLRSAGDHTIGAEFITYHNTKVYRG